MVGRTSVTGRTSPIIGGGVKWRSIEEANRHLRRAIIHRGSRRGFSSHFRHTGSSITPNGTASAQIRYVINFAQTTRHGRCGINIYSGALTPGICFMRRRAARRIVPWRTSLAVYRQKSLDAVANEKKGSRYTWAKRGRRKRTRLQGSNTGWKYR